MWGAHRNSSVAFVEVPVDPAVLVATIAERRMHTITEGSINRSEENKRYSE